MIKNTFTFIPGVGPKTEESLWEKGIFSWHDFEKGCVGNERIREYINLAKNALKNKDASFFANNLPQNEHWRLYSEFANKTVFLDIETTGLSRYYDVITMIGAFDGKEVKLFIKDNNLGEIEEYLNKFDIIVTFNGTLFDLPFIKHEFPQITFPPVHIDLRFLLKTLGIKGSLKHIEAKLGINREKGIKKINGREAAVLWSRFVKQDDECLRTLILYNIYDTTDLKKLMEFGYKKKIQDHILPRFRRESKQPDLFNRKNSVINIALPRSKFIVPKITLKRRSNAIEVFAGNKSLAMVDRKLIKKPDIKLNDLIKKIKLDGHAPLAIGIDLTGSENRPSGVCILDKKSAKLSMVKTNEELIELAKKIKPDIISIDSPLSLPKNRDCASDTCECRKYGIMRECERILKRRGINVYPCLIPSMQKLTMRGIHLTSIFENLGLKVIESYPGAAQDILGFPRKRIDLKALEIDLMNMGIKPESDKETITHDELDALTSAIVGYFYRAGMYEAIGNKDEKYLIIPDLETNT